MDYLIWSSEEPFEIGTVIIRAYQWAELTQDHPAGIEELEFKLTLSYSSQHFMLFSVLCEMFQMFQNIKNGYCQLHN